MSKSTNIQRAGAFFTLLALWGCGSNNESSLPTSFNEAQQLQQQIHAKTLETIEGYSPTVLARVEPFSFTASDQFTRSTRTYSFYESLDLFPRQEPAAGERDQIWNPSAQTFMAINAGPHSDLIIDGLPSRALIDDGNTLKCTNNQTGESFELSGLTTPSAPFGASINYTVNETNAWTDGSTWRRYYSGVASLSSGWRVGFTKLSSTSDQVGTTTYGQTSLSTITFVQPTTNPKTIRISGQTATHSANNNTLDFDITTVNTTLQGWGVQVEKDNQIVKTLGYTTDPRGPGTGTGTNPVHVSLNWDGLDNNNQPVTGNITWVTTANTTTFVPGGNLNDGVNSVQARYADNLDSSELTVTEIKADEAQPFQDEEGNIVSNPNLYYSQNPSVKQILVLAGDPTPPGSAGVSARATTGKVKELSLTLNRTGLSREVYDIRIVDPDHPDQILSDVRALEFVQGASTATVALPVRLGTRVHRFPFLKVQTKNTTRLPAGDWQNAKHVQFEPIYYSPIGSALAPFSSSQPLGDRALRLAWELAEGCETDQDVRTKVSQRLGPWLVAHHFIYTPGSFHYQLDGSAALAEREIFDFKSFAQHMDDADLITNYFYGDCHDVSLTAAMACAAVGVEQNLMAFFPGSPQPGSEELNMFTNLLKIFAELSVGDISLAANAKPLTFTYWAFGQHQCTYFGGLTWDGLGQLQSGPSLSALSVNDYLDALINRDQSVVAVGTYIVTPHTWVQFQNGRSRYSPERITYPDPRVSPPIKLTGITQ